MEIGPIGCGTTRTEKGLLIFKLPPYISSMLYLLLLSGPSFHCVRKSIETGNKPEISQPSHHPISYNVVVDNWFPSLDICRLLRWVSLGWEWSVWYLYSRNYDGQAVEGHQNPVTGNWCRSLCVCVYVCVCALFVFNMFRAVTSEGIHTFMTAFNLEMKRKAYLQDSVLKHVCHVKSPDGSHLTREY